MERELRRRIKATFDERGIEIPYARRVVIFQNADGKEMSPEVLLRSRSAGAIA